MIGITGANGFIGTALQQALIARSVQVRAFSRTASDGAIAVGKVDDKTDWAPHLQNLDTIIHLAARTHSANNDSLAELQQINVAGSIRLAQQAAQSKVRRLIFLSSIKVNGENTELGSRFSSDDSPAPEDAYGRSKLEAEQALKRVSLETGLELCIIRPPLVYGPGVKGNFLRLMEMVHKGIPFPFGRVDNRRSLIGVGNLADLIFHCVSHPVAAGGTFMASDGEDLSTADLQRRLGKALGRPARLVPIPVSFMLAGSRLLGRQAAARRLLGSLQIDISETKARLGWEPPLSVDAELDRAANYFLKMAG